MKHNKIISSGLRESSFFGRFSFVFILISFFSITGSLAQTKYNGLPSLIWPKLYNVQYVKTKDNLGEYDKPVFSKEAKALDGKVVTLPGYMIPFENGIKGTTFILSSLPINACFFCGVGGPESVIEVNMKQPVSFNEKPIEIKGILRLNNTDPDRMIYRIEQAEYLGEAEF
ncbi:MAG TPA: DUF3299 domain-containing protein [Cyclobacteriaceae bacterium]